MRYERVESVDAACASLARGGRALAGGTDVVLMRSGGSAGDDWVVDLKALAELTGIDRRPEGLVVGPMTTMKALSRSAVGGEFDGIRDSASLVGAPQTRARATIGGNICRSSPSGDTLPSLLAVDAELTLVSVRGERRVRAAEFFTGPGTNVLADDELLASIFVPMAGRSSAYGRVTYRAALDLAVVGVAVRLSVQDGVCVDARVALGGVAPTPLLVSGAAEALRGDLSDRRGPEAAGALAAEACTPISDIRGTAEYRRHAVGVLTARMAMLAWDRAGGSS